MKILNDLLKNIAILEAHGNVDTIVSSVSLNSKIIEPRSLFVALSGNVVDGHDYINDCIEKGATVIIYEKDIRDFKEGITYVKVSDTHEAIGIISSNFYGNPSNLLKLVGVTGTNGKTTTVTLLHQLFRNLGYKAGMIGTVVNKINDKSKEAMYTTPDPVTLNELLREMIDDECEYCFMEVSSHSVVEKRIAGLKFVGGIFTNLSLDHLDYHKTIENYHNAKKAFFDVIHENGFALVNIDDAQGEYMASHTKAKKYTYSLKKEADFNERLETKLLGEFNAYNILAIYSAAKLLLESKTSTQDGFILEGKIKEIIKTLESVPGRFQYIKDEESGIIGIVDYAHTPDALENVLRTINNMKTVHVGHGHDLLSTSDMDSKIITVIGCGGDRDRIKRPIMAKIGYDMSDILIITSDNPRTEKPEDILNDMLKGIESLSQEKVYIISDRHQAIKKAVEISREGDYILVAGKGHENYQEVNGVKTHFDDMEELKKYLE